MTEKIVIDDILINYTKVGESADATLIFLHGWRSDLNVWNSVIKEFGDIKATMYFLDLPGFGGSALPKSAFSVGDYANLIKKFIEKKNLSRVVLVGHSVGGRISIKFTAENPDLVEKLILVDSAGFVSTDKKIKTYNKLAKIVKPFFKPKFMQDLRKKIYKSIDAEDYVETPELNETFKRIISEDLSMYLPQIKKPTLIIWGEKDTDTPLSFAEKMNHEIKDSSLYIIKGGSHYSYLDSPEEFAKEIIKFIGEK